jgi:hypothetical protein
MQISMVLLLLMFLSPPPGGVGGDSIDAVEHEWLICIYLSVACCSN